MKKRIIKPCFSTTITIALTITVFTNVQAFTHQKSLETQIESEFKIIKKIASEQETVLQIDRTSEMSSEAKTMKGILVFNLKQLHSITNTVGVKYQTDIIRLIIAHEMGHQIQYRNNIYTTAGNLLYECQADVIAGYLIFLRLAIEGGEWQKNNSIYNVTNVKYQEKIKEWSNRINATLSALFSEGSNFIISPSHPTNDERQLALRDGYKFGNVYLFGDFLENDAVLSKSVNANSMRETCKRYKSLLGYLPGDNLLSWSYRHARKIIHSYLPNCRDITVYSNWNIDSSRLNTNINYTQYITNSGNKKITFSFYNQVYIAKRSEVRNKLYWDLVSTGSHNITLSPKETKFISGNLEFLATNEHTAIFVYPGAAGALFSCTTLSDGLDYNSNIAGSRFTGDKMQSDTDIMEAFLLMRDLFSKLIGGVGLSDQPGATDKVYYLSKIQLSNAYTTQILYDKTINHYNLNVLYYQGNSKTEATQIAHNAIKTLNTIKYSTKENSSTSNNQERMWEIFGSDQKHIGKIQIKYSPSFMEYETSLVIFGL